MKNIIDIIPEEQKEEDLILPLKDIFKQNLAISNWLWDKDGKQDVTALDNSVSYDLYFKMIFNQIILGLKEIQTIPDNIKNHILFLIEEIIPHLVLSNPNRKKYLIEISKQFNNIIKNNIEYHQELIPILANIEISLNCNFHAREEAIKYEDAASLYLDILGFKYNNIEEQQDIITDLVLQKDDNSCIDDFRKHDLTQLKKDLKKQIESGDSKSNKAKYLYDALEDFALYKQADVPIIYLAHFQRNFGIFSSLLFSRAIGIKDFGIEIGLLFENATKHENIIQNPEQTLDLLFSNPLTKQHYQKFGRFRMAFPYSDSSRQAHITSLISKLLMEYNFIKYLKNHQIELKIDSGSGLQNARGGMTNILNSQEVTWQNATISCLGVDPQKKSEVLLISFAKQLIQKLENYHNKPQELITEESFNNFLNIFIQSFQKKTELRYNENYNKFLMLSGFKIIAVDLFKLHRSERHEINQCSNTIENTNNITEKDILDGYHKNGGYRELRAISDDFLQSLLNANQWYGLYDILKDQDIKNNPIIRDLVLKATLSLDRSAQFKDILPLFNNKYLDEDCYNEVKYLFELKDSEKNKFDELCKNNDIEIIYLSPSERKEFNKSIHIICQLSNYFIRNVFNGIKEPLNNAMNELNINTENLNTAKYCMFNIQHGVGSYTTFIKEAEKDLIKRYKNLNQELPIPNETKKENNKVIASRYICKEKYMSQQK